MKDFKKFLALTIYLLFAWIIFSLMGFLPRVYSFPIPEKLVKSKGPILVADNNMYFRNIQSRKNTVAAGTIDSYNFFDNNNFDQIDYNKDDDITVTGGYYDANKRAYYFGTKWHYARANIEKNEYREIKAKGKDLSFDTLIKYQDIYIDTSPNSTSVTFNGGYKRQLFGDSYDKDYSISTEHLVGSYDVEEYDFNKIYEILERNENEKISLHEFTQILALIHKSTLLKWNPEENIAIFTNVSDNNRYFYKVSSVDGNPEKFGPYETENLDYYRYSDNSVLVNNKNEKKLYILNFETGETRDLTTTPNIEYLRIGINENGKATVVAVADNDKLWAYSEELNKTKDYDVKTRKYDVLILGDDTFIFATDSFENDIFDNCHCLDLDFDEKAGE